jgi:hypothetical protein
VGDKAKAKAKAKKKRDANQPTPKPGKKKSLVVKVLMMAIVLILSTWIGLYSLKVEKGPWDWKEAEWSGFLTFSKEQVEAARKQVEEVDWEELKEKVTAKTKELWNRIPELEEKLEAKLAALRGKKKAAASKTGEPGPMAASAAPSSEELGCETLRLAIGEYKGSMDNQKKLKKAKALFQKAQDHLMKAYEEAEAAGDAEHATEIEGYIMQCNVYLEDCSKREMM